MLNEQRNNLVDAADQLGKFGALVGDAVNQTKENLVRILRELGPVLESARQRRPEPDPGAQRDCHLPVPERDHRKWQRGDYANLTAIVDLHAQPHRRRCLHRHPVGVRSDRLELQWGRTIGQFPSPCTAGGRSTRRQPADHSVPLGPGAVMHLHRRAKIQLAIFTVIALVALALMSLQFMKLPAKMFGVGRYTVTVELPEASWALWQQQRHVPRRRGRPGGIGTPDRLPASRRCCR